MLKFIDYCNSKNYIARKILICNNNAFIYILLKHLKRSKDHKRFSVLFEYYFYILIIVELRLYSFNFTPVNNYIKIK